jgi:hypothetical protein
MFESLKKKVNLEKPSNIQYLPVSNLLQDTLKKVQDHKKNRLAVHCSQPQLVSKHMARLLGAAGQAVGQAAGQAAGQSCW